MTKSFAISSYRGAALATILVAGLLTACGPKADASSAPAETETAAATADSGATTTAASADAAAKPATATPAAKTAEELSGDAVRDLAKIPLNGLNGDNSFKMAFFDRYFPTNNDPCTDADPAEMPVNKICNWNASANSAAPALMLGVSWEKRVPIIVTAVVMGKHGAQPLGAAWKCQAAEQGDAQICFPTSTSAADRTEGTAQWNRFLSAAG